MSDAEAGPSTSRSTRRSGDNSTDVAAESPAMVRNRESHSTEASRASSGTPSQFTTKEERTLFTPSYGGNFFTAPRSTKREAKKNSRFSPDILPTRHKQSGSDKLFEAAAAFEETAPKPAKKIHVNNLKDTTGIMNSINKSLKQQAFGLPHGFGGKGADLYRQVPKDQWGKTGATNATTKAKGHRQKSVNPPDMPPLPPPTSKSTIGAFAGFNFGSLVNEPPLMLKKIASIPPSSSWNMMPEENNETEEDDPPRGRIRTKASEEREQAQDLRSHLKTLKVKEEMLSDNEEVPVKQPPGRKGRKKEGRQSLPPPPTAASVVSAPRRRRKSGVAVKQEVVDDYEEMTMDERKPMRREMSLEMRGNIKTEDDGEDKREGDRKSRTMSVRINMDESPTSDQPSTSAAAAAADDRSISRKRGRQPRASIEKTNAVEPAVKRMDRRRSTRPDLESEEREEMQEEESVKSTPGKHRNRRTARQMLMADLRDEEKIEDQAEDGMMNTRGRSFRGNADDAADAATTTRISPRANKPTGSASVPSRAVGRPKRDKNELVYIPPLKDYNEFEDEEREASDYAIGEGKKSSLSFVDTSASTSMLMDESTAEGRSGYGEDTEFDMEHDEIGTSADEGEASTSAAAAVPVKRGRGRPRRDGLPPRQNPPKTPRKMDVEPMLRDRRSNVLSQKFVEYMTDETTKIARRASAGAGLVSTSRTLAAGGVSIDLPSPRIRPPTPPPPEVKAAPGSALHIMRALGKKKLPSIRSPSPPVAAIPRRGLLPALAAVAATLAEAPSINDAAAAAAAVEEKEEENIPGPSRKMASVHAPPHHDKKEKEEEKEKKKEEEEVCSADMAPIQPIERKRLVDYASTSNSSSSSQEEKDPVTGKLKLKESPEPTEEVKEGQGGTEKGEGEEKEAEEVKEEEIKNEEVTAKAEQDTPASPVKEEEPGVLGDVLARWNESRKAIDQKRLEAGLPVLPPSSSTADEVAAAPLAPRPSRRSVNAPTRFGDFDYSIGDVRKRSATVTTPSTQPMSPGLVDTTRRRRKKEEAAATPTTTKEKETAAGAAEGEEKQQQPATGSRRRSRAKKDKKRPRIVLKLKLPGGNSAAVTPVATPAAMEEEPMEDYPFGDVDEEGVSSSAAAAATLSTTTPSMKKKDKKGRVRPKAFVPRWKRQTMPHLGFIELDGKQVESVTLTCAAAIDAMLAEVCADGIQKSTLTMKEQSSEHSRLSVAKRRALGLIGVPPPAGGRPKPVPLPIPPREERTKRIRHAPQSKEYDNLTVLADAPVEQVNNSSFQALAGLERKPATERRKESRQDVALKKASMVVADRLPVKEVEVPVEKPKKDRRREREEVVNKNAISYDELLRQKTLNMDRLPGRVLNDPAEYFYREIFTDDLADGVIDENSPDVDVIGFTEPRPDDQKSFVGFGVQAVDASTKLIEVLPRPPPYPDEDDGLEEEREWMEDDMKRALSHHSSSRIELVDKALRVINSQRTTDLSVQGTKGEQDLLYNSYLVHAYRLKELLPIFSEFRLGESSWLHRSLIRLLPSYLLPVYLELIRFLRSIDSKHSAVLSKSLMDKGVDTEWDELFEKDPHTDDDLTEPMLTTDNDRTEPMLHGSAPATATNSSQAVAAADAADDDVTATMEAILKALEKAELETAETAAAVDAPSPDSNDGGLVIDEEPQEETAAPAAPPTDAAETEAVAAEAAPLVEQIGDVAIVEDVIVETKEEKKKPSVASVCSILAEVTEKKVREANADTIQNSINPHLLGDVIPILIAPVFDIEEAPEDFLMKNRPHEYIYRLIRYATPTPYEFKTIRPRVPAGEISVAEAMDAAVDFVVAAVKAAVKNKGNKRVVLFGWGLSCYINLRVAQLLHGISAIINFAFPMRTVDGWRGTPDDDINLTYCPTLFVMGAEAEDFDPYEMLLLRQNMIQPPGVLVLGSADSQLNISSLRLSRERITQKIAARMILEQVINFINLPSNQLERAKLVPLQLNNVYFVEPSAVKAYTGQEAQQALVAGGARRTTIPHTPIDGVGMTAAQSLARRQQQQLDNRRKRSRLSVEEQTTAVGRLTSSIASSAAPITKRSRTDDIPTTSYGGRIGSDYRFSVPVPSPLASPALNSPGLPGFRTTHRPTILSHNHHYNYHNPALPSPIVGGSSTSAAAAASSSVLLLQTVTTRPANAAAAAAPSPRGPLDPASISLS